MIKRISGLLAALTAVTAGADLGAQQVVYVDVEQPSPPGSGTAADPYKSVSWAVNGDYPPYSPPPPSPGSMVWVAGHPTLLYTNTSRTLPDRTENFPIKVPPGVAIRYWDRYPGVNPPPSAVFTRGDAPADDSVCFLFREFDSALESDLLGVVSRLVPVSWRGFEIRDFEEAVLVRDASDLNNDAISVELQGIAVWECQNALTISSTIGDQPNDQVGAARMTLRTPQSLWDSDANPFVQAEVKSGSRLSFTLDTADIRPNQTDYDNTLIGLEVDGSAQSPTGQASGASFVVRNAVLEGRPDSPPGGPPPWIQGAGIEFWIHTHGGITDRAYGTLTLDGVRVRDCAGEGLLAVAEMGSTASLTVTDSDLPENGYGPTVSPPFYGSSAGFSRSGMHVAALEDSAWSLVDVSGSRFDDNYRPGVFLHGHNFHDEDARFGHAHFVDTEFLRNGLPLEDAEQGHGFYCQLKETVLDLEEVVRCELSANHSSGFKMLVGPNDTLRAHFVRMTNSALSRNQAKGSLELPNLAGRDVAPFTIEVLDPTFNTTTTEVQLLQVSSTDNEASYAVSLFHHAGNNTNVLWWGQSVASNCIFHANNGYIGSSKNTAYYPEPAVGSGPQLWEAMYGGTFSSCLGQDGVPPNRYGTDRSNFTEDPQLMSVPFMPGLGEIFPQTIRQGAPVDSRVTDRGLSPYAPGPLDVRREDRTVDYPPLTGVDTPDVGAVEVQGDE